MPPRDAAAPGSLMMAWIALLLMAVLLFAAFSRRLEMSLFTMPIAFTALGYLLHLGGARLLGEEAGFAALHLIAEITLVLLLFSDASKVRFDHLRMHAWVPMRMLLVAMPLSLAAGTLVAYAVSPGEPLAFAVLVAAILTPTDAALGQAVVENEAVPDDLREAIAVESGLNDGLALPVVIVAGIGAALATGGMAHNQQDNVWLFAIAQIALGPVAGLATGFLAAKLRDVVVARELATDAYQGIFFIAAAFLCFAVAETIGGNGLIAAFVGGLTFGNVRSSANPFVAEFMESEGRLLTMATFAIFGAVLVPRGVEHASLPTVLLAVGFLTVVRIVPVVVSLAGTGLAWREKLFLGWFGPRGLASILFALLVMEGFDFPAMDELVACVVLTVLLSIMAHGASAQPIARAFARRAQRAGSR